MSWGQILFTILITWLPLGILATFLAGLFNRIGILTSEDDHQLMFMGPASILALVLRTLFQSFGRTFDFLDSRFKGVGRQINKLGRGE